MTDVQDMPGARVLDGRFTAVQQAVGTSTKNKAAIAFLRDFVEEMKASGMVGNYITRHEVEGRLLVAPPA
jgi:polar amino acid transport system substrate-binding protein